MKTPILCLALLAAAVGADAQEPLPRLDAVKFAALLNFDLEKLAGTPIPTDADIKRPYGLKAGQRGGLVVPEAKLSAATFDHLGRDVQPIGQLWLAGLLPTRNGQAVSRDELKLVSVEREGREVTLPLFTLGARKAAGDELELLIYGKSRTPLLTLPLAKASPPQKWPIELSAEGGGGSARVTLYLVGQYEAAFEVAPAAE